MENILQSIVKIIIIGIVLKTPDVEANRQFFPPQFPYYQFEDHYLPGFLPPYPGFIPVYYREANSPAPIPYKNSNSYDPPNLFQQNDNYNPTEFANPNLRYSVPQIFQYKPNHYPPYIPEAKINIKIPQVPTAPVEASHKKPYYTTNIIVKEEHPPPFHHDDYNKNYQEDDYNDNYSDDSSTLSKPCLRPPFRYFEPSQSNNADLEKYSLCNPYFQPNFGNSVYTVKMPITLLPSRFPPRVEQLIERIQNYFSTYTEKETPKPQNEIKPTTTIQPSTEGTSESEANSSATVSEVYRENVTAEILEFSPVKNSQPSEITTAVGLTVDNKEEEMTSTSIPVAYIKKESQMIIQSSQNSKEMTENISTESPLKFQEMTEQNPQASSAEVSQIKESEIDQNSLGNRILRERDYSDRKTENLQAEKNFTDVTGQSTATETTEMAIRAEETNSVRPTNDSVFEVTDKNG